ncbi:MAG: hypothetical protein RLZZ511_4353 [Cyanobacteriota bacterium]|jgi:tetratricopeptide (TPR) repeat protein
MNRSIALILLGMLTISPVMIMGSAIEVQAESIENRKAEADRLLNQGIQQYEADKLEDAFQSWQQALRLYQTIKDRGGEGAALGSLGNAYASLGKYDKAIEYYEKALAIAREIKSQDGQGTTLINLGAVYVSLNQ